MKKLSFQTLRNVLTGLEEGLSYSQITQWTQTSKASVSRIAQAADQTGQSTKQLLALSDSELISLIYPPSPLARTEPDWASINTQLKRKNVTKRLLYERYLAQAGVTPYNYSSFCRRLAQWRLDNGLVSVGAMLSECPVSAWKSTLPVISCHGSTATATFSIASCLSPHCRTAT